MEFFYIKSNNGSLFSCYHTANKDYKKKVGVVLCYPIGQEYIRCQQIFLKLAHDLSQNGIDVLRFEYFGIGDSEGYFKDALTDIWKKDIEKAVEELKNGANINKIILVGARFGASLAANLASESEVSGLVMWSPIHNGCNYINEIKLKYKKWLDGSFAKQKNYPFYIDIHGFPFTKKLINDIRLFDILKINYNQKINILLIDEFNRDTQSLFNHFIDLGMKATLREIINDRFWDKSNNENTKRLTPIEDIQTIVDWIKTTNLIY